MHGEADGPLGDGKRQIVAVAQIEAQRRVGAGADQQRTPGEARAHRRVHVPAREREDLRMLVQQPFEPLAVTAIEADRVHRSHPGPDGRVMERQQRGTRGLRGQGLPEPGELVIRQRATFAAGRGGVAAEDPQLPASGAEVHRRASGCIARPEVRAQQIAVVVVARDRMHGQAEGSEQLAGKRVGRRRRLVDEIPAQQQRRRSRLERCNSTHGVFQACLRAGLARADAQMQVAELHEQRR